MDGRNSDNRCEGWLMRTLKFLASIGVLAIVGAIAAGIYFFGGYYSVRWYGRRPKPGRMGIGARPYRFD
jgi:hypothetical protein